MSRLEEDSGRLLDEGVVGASEAAQLVTRSPAGVAGEEKGDVGVALEPLGHVGELRGEARGVALEAQGAGVGAPGVAEAGAGSPW